MSDVSLIDVNVTLGQWPTRRVPCDELPGLVAKLREHHVIEAWAGSFDGLFQEDLSAVNHRLARDCRSQNGLRLVPFGEINPLAPRWREELARSANEHGMPGIRLHPNYHSYTLDHPEFARLMKAAADRKLIVQLTVLMEDERMMHSLMRVPAVDLTPLPGVLAATPGARVVLLNALKAACDERLAGIINAGDVYCEIAMLEDVDGVGQLITELPPDRILFGSHAPSLYFESSVLKLKESALPAPHLRAISHANARRLLAE